MTASELFTYQTDRAKWLEAASARLAARINQGTYAGLELSHAWSCMERDYQAATWALLDEAARTRVKTVRLQTQLRDST